MEKTNRTMTTRVIVEEPLIILQHSDYNGGNTRQIYSQMLRNALVGDVFSVEWNQGCNRAVYDETLKVVFKDDYGAACVLHVYATSDEPNPMEMKYDDELIWFQYGE